MCGITGICGEANETRVRRMAEVMSHHGPDDWGTKVFDYGDLGVSLGHRRLSIIDLSEASHEPMTLTPAREWVE